MNQTRYSMDDPRILAVVRNMPSTISGIAEALSIHFDEADARVRYLKKHGLAYVAKWHSGGRGRPAGVYAAGEGVDAKPVKKP